MIFRRLQRRNSGGTGQVVCRTLLHSLSYARSWTELAVLPGAV